uniref:Uncharacterized protein n=1 Tax=Moniliophthora roreri TaxID=221103 RepID=A0A0W0GC39_MONRR
MKCTTGGGKDVGERILSHDPFLRTFTTHTSYEYLEEKGTPRTLDPSVVPASL